MLPSRGASRPSVSSSMCLKTRGGRVLHCRCRSFAGHLYISSSAGSALGLIVYRYICAYLYTGGEVALLACVCPRFLAGDCT